MSELQSRRYPIDEDMPFQTRTWTVERVGWIFLGVVLLIALTGTFGSGPLSTQRTGGAAFNVEYERFQRATKLARYVLHLKGAGDEQQVLLSPVFQRAYEVADIQPKPSRSTAGPAGLDLRFMSAGELTVVIRAHPRRSGPVNLELASGQVRLRAWSFVYP
jgi:hypothetical protein